MGQYILKRVLISIPVLLGVTIVIFMLVHLAPGDPVTGMIDPTTGNLDSNVVEMERAKLGLDKPLPVQYVLWLGRVLKGDLGYSLINGRPVGPMIWGRIWPTMQITLLALIFSVVFGIVLGIITAIKQYSFLDYLSNFLSMGAVSIPGFFLALGFISIFALRLNWLPTSGMETLGREPSLWDKLPYLVMPVTVLGIANAAPIMRYARTSMLEVLNQEYVNVVRAKGAKEVIVILRHALPNAMIPLITVIGLKVPQLFAGSVIVEQIFHWQGMGTLNISSVLNQDYTVLMGLNLIVAILVMLSNLITDIAYAYVDPKIRYE